MNIITLIILILVIFIFIFNSKYIKYKSIYKNVLTNLKNIIDEQLQENNKKKQKKKKNKKDKKENRYIDEDNITIGDLMNASTMKIQKQELQDNNSKISEENNGDEVSILSNMTDITLNDINSNCSDDSVLTMK